MVMRQDIIEAIISALPSRRLDEDDAEAILAAVTKASPRVAALLAADRRPLRRDDLVLDGKVVLSSHYLLNHGDRVVNGADWRGEIVSFRFLGERGEDSTIDDDAAVTVLRVRWNRDAHVSHVTLDMLGKLV